MKIHQVTRDLPIGRLLIERFQMSEARAELQQEMEHIWTDYVSRVRPDLSGSKQIEGWAAGLEYLASKIAADQ